MRFILLLIASDQFPLCVQMQPRRIACAFPRKSKMQLASRSLSLLLWSGDLLRRRAAIIMQHWVCVKLEAHTIALSHDHIKNAELSQTAYESPALDHLL